MFMEIAVAVNYILSHLYTKLPRRRVDSFGEELERYLQVKFQHHWFPDDPLRDSAYRCINSVGPQVELLLPEAAAVSGLEWSEIEACLPEGLVISIDPGHVACQYNQPNCQAHDRFSSNHWPSSSVSLSSSGCSSASSSISSTNLTSNSTQITHQVLYCLQDGWTTNITSVQSENRRDPILTKIGRSENDHGDLLATAAALSVLVEPDEGIDTKVELNTMYAVSSSPFNQKSWDGESIGINTSVTNEEESSKTPLNEINLKSINPLQTEIGQEKESFTNMTSFPWSVSENGKVPALFSRLANESVEGSPSTIQSMVFNAKTHTFPLFHRSSSNPPQSGQFTAPHFNEFIALSANCVNSNLLSSKFDQPIHQVINHISPKSFPAHIQPLNASVTTHPFVQKSTSTPSFTAATFAQTKFGSTKLKNHTKRTPTRILSPTTVQQSLATANTANFLSNETVPSSFLAGNQRFEASHSSNMTAFQCLLPMNIEITTTKSTGCVPINGSDQSNPNLQYENGSFTPEMKFLSMSSFHQRSVYNNNSSFPSSHLENYLTHHSPENTSPNSVLERIHLNEVQNGQTLSNYWQPSLYEQHLESTNTTTTTEGTVIKSGNANFDNLVLCTNWNNNCNAPTNSNIFNLPNNQLLNTDFKSSMTRLLSTSSNGPAVMEQNPVQEKRNSKPIENIINGNACTTTNLVSMSNNGNDCLLDDVLLSTRMVNLLLEEDNLTDPLNHDIPVSYLEEGGEIEGFASEKNHLLTNTISDLDTTLNNNKIHSSGDNGNNNHSTTNDFFTSGKCKESNLIQSVASTSSLITDNLSSVLATEFVQSF